MDSVTGTLRAAVARWQRLPFDPLAMSWGSPHRARPTYVDDRSPATGDQRNATKETPYDAERPQMTPQPQGGDNGFIDQRALGTRGHRKHDPDYAP